MALVSDAGRRSLQQPWAAVTSFDSEDGADWRASLYFLRASPVPGSSD
jgi:hypothetical protein